MFTRTLAALVALSFAGAASASTVDGNVAAGQEKSKTCAACHGPTGNESTDGQYPKLAGQYPEYLAKSLQDYKSGKRKNAIMAGFAAALSDQDINDLSVFFAAQKGELRDLSDVDSR